jgi:hypothetical protein
VLQTDFYGNGESWEVFDLKADPNELKNDYANPKNQALITRLKQALKTLIMEYKDREAADMLAKEGI